MANDPKALNLDVLLEICRVTREVAENTADFIDEISAAAQIATKFKSQHDHTLANITTLITSALARLQQYNPTHLPFGYSGPKITSASWVDRDDVERVAKQIVGMTHPTTDAEYISFAVISSVDEAVTLGFVELQRYDGWRPGMQPGSGWQDALRAMQYGVMRAKAMAAPQLAKTKSQQASPVPNSEKPVVYPEAQPKNLSNTDRESQNHVFKKEYYRQREELAKAAEEARKKADLPSLLRHLIKEIELWISELKHETLVLFQDSEHGEFARSLTGGGPDGMGLLPGYIVIDFMLTPWVDDLLELSLAEQQVKSFRSRMSTFNKLRHEFAIAVTKQVPNWNAKNPNYDEFVVIDEQRKDLKAAAFDFCAYIDTLANVAAANSSPSKAASLSTPPQEEQPQRAARAMNSALPDVNSLLEDANGCLMNLAAVRRDGQIVLDTGGRMEGGGEDWHFASPEDESGYRSASARLKRQISELIKPLNRILAWGQSCGLEVYENADCLLKPRSTWIQMEDCECLERDVRSIMNQLVVEKAKFELASIAAPLPHSDPELVWLAAETIKSMAGSLLLHAVMVKLDKPSKYDNRDVMSRDAKLAEKHGYLVAAVARSLSLDDAPLLRVLREDRLWEYPSEPGDSVVFKAVLDLADRVSAEAQVWCAQKGIDPRAGFTSSDVVTPPSVPAAIPDMATDDKSTTELSAQPAVKLGRRGESCWVRGIEKAPLTDAQYDVIEALIKAGESGMKKDLLERVRSSARRILTAMQQDPDWAKVIVMPGQTNGRYRLRQ